MCSKIEDNNTDFENNLYFKKYHSLIKSLDCAVWEYSIEEKKLTSIKKLDGKWSDTNLILENYRETMLNWNIIHPDDIDKFLMYCESMDNAEENFTHELRVLSDSDDYRWFRYKGSAIKEPDGKSLYVVGTTEDVTKIKFQENEIYTQLNYDECTGLLNKTATKNSIIQKIKNYNHHMYTFLLITIDDEKYITNTFGLSFYKNTIKKVSDELKKIVSKNDILGILKTNTFVIFKNTYASHNSISETANLILDTIKNIKFNGGYTLNTHIGISVFPHNGNTFKLLYLNAKTALQEAKNIGYNSYYIYKNSISPYLNTKISLSDITNLEKNLLNFIFNSLMSSSPKENPLLSIISEIGTFYNLNRIYILSASTNSFIIWDAKDNKQSIETIISKNISKLENRFYTSDYFVTNDISDFEYFEERELWNQLSVKSFIQKGFYTNGKFNGFISFEDCNDCRNWSAEIVSILSLVSKIIELYINKTNTSISKNLISDYAQKILSSIDSISYVVDPENYRLIYNTKNNTINDSISSQNFCYKIIANQKSPCKDCPLKFSLNVKNHHLENHSNYYKVSSNYFKNDSEKKLCCLVWEDNTSRILDSNDIDELTHISTLEKFTVDCNKILQNKKTDNFSVLYINIINYKDALSEIGFKAADEILKLFAGELKASLNKDEFICRVKGSEFIILYKYMNLTKLLTRIQVSLKSTHALLKNKYNRLDLCFVNGLYHITPEDYSINYCIDNAHTAMKSMAESKDLYEVQTATFNDYLYEKQCKNEILEANMADALLNNEFKVYLQPIYDLQTKKIVSAEALVRWIDDNNNIFYPYDFVSLFEKNGYIAEIDFYVYKRLFSRLRSWLDKGLIIKNISLNISKITLLQNNFEEEFESIINFYKIPKKIIEIEITESIVIPNLDKLLIIINSLKQKGFNISLDNFGTGLSSLKLIKLLPIDTIKLDRQFFSNNSIEDTSPIVTEIIDYTKKLNLKSVAVGVETEEQSEFLITSDCSMAQGYFYYGPVSLDDFEKLL